MFSIILLLIPLFCLVMGILLPWLSYRTTDDGSPAKVPAFYRTAWVLPIVLAMLFGALINVAVFTGPGPTIGDTRTLVFSGFFVPLSFLYAFLVTRATKDRTILFIALTISAVFASIAALIPAFITTYLAYQDSEITRLFTVVQGLYPAAAFAFALYERKDVAERGFKHAGVTSPVSSASETSGVRFRHVWFLPLVIPALFGFLITLLVGSIGTENSMVWMLVIVDLLVPLSFLLGFFATRAKKERAALQVTSAICMAFAVIAAILPRTAITSSQYAHAPQTIITTLALCFYPTAALFYALWKRKEILERANRRIERAAARGNAKEARQLDLSSPGPSSRTNRQSSSSVASEATTRALFEEALGVSSASLPDATSETIHASTVTAASAPTPAQVNPVVEAVSPTAPPPSGQNVSQAPSPTATAMVDVNKCVELDLLGLSGMTITIARAAINERDEHGPYASVEDFIQRNSLKPHLVVMFIDNLTCTRPSLRSGGNRRTRTLDL